MTHEVEEASSRILLQILSRESLVASDDEAYAIIESILEEDDHKIYGNASDCTNHECFIRYALREYFGLDNKEVKRLIQKHASLSTDEGNNIHRDDDENSVDDGRESTNCDTDDEQDEETIGPGECDLCERDASKLTRHHLIPKSTWKRMEPMIFAQWNAVVSDSARVARTSKQSILFDEFEHLVPVLVKMVESEPNLEALRGRHEAARKRIIRVLLGNQTIEVCRPCHNHIHRSYDNRTLALQYNTLNKLLNDETILKYAKWASRQRRFKI
jgi:hypothetical protein